MVRQSHLHHHRVLVQGDGGLNDLLLDTLVGSCLLAGQVVSLQVADDLHNGFQVFERPGDITTNLKILSYYRIKYLAQREVMMT